MLYLRCHSWTGSVPVRWPLRSIRRRAAGMENRHAHRRSTNIAVATAAWLRRHWQHWVNWIFRSDPIRSRCVWVAGRASFRTLWSCWWQNEWESGWIAVCRFQNMFFFLSLWGHMWFLCINCLPLKCGYGPISRLLLHMQGTTQIDADALDFCHYRRNFDDPTSTHTYIDTETMR